MTELNLSDRRVDPEEMAELLSRQVRARHAKRRRETYFPAVNRFEALAVNQLHPHALVLWMEMRRMIQMRWGQPFTLGDHFLGDVGILPRTRDHVLEAMEKAGLIQIERHRGGLPRIWVIDRPDDD